MNCRIVLDTNEVNFNRGLLSRINCTVDIANNGLEAIELLKKNIYPLILLDIEMPILGN